MSVNPGLVQCVAIRLRGHEDCCHALQALVAGNHPARGLRVPRYTVRVVEWVG